MNYFIIPGLKGAESLSPKYKADRIIQSVGYYLGIEREEFLRKNRNRPNVYARQLCCYLLREQLKLTLKPIMELLRPAKGAPCITNHTTVIHGYQYIVDQLHFEHGQTVKTDVENILRIYHESCNMPDLPPVPKVRKPKPTPKQKKQVDKLFVRIKASYTNKNHWDLKEAI